MRLFVALVIATLTLSGCTGLAIPDDALQDGHDDLASATMHAWTRPGDGFVQVFGVFSDRSAELLKVDVRDPYDAWRINITDSNGESIIFDDRATCHFPWPEVRGPNLHEEFRFTWLHEQYDGYADCGRGEALQPSMVPAGDYMVTLQFRLTDFPDDAFEIALPVTVA